MHPLLRAAAEHQRGLVTAADARRAGYGHAEIRHLCTSGRWHRLRRGIYIQADDLARVQQEGRKYQIDCLAVLLALGRTTAVLSHGSAARLWGFPRRHGRDEGIRLTDPTHGRDGRGFHVSRGPLLSEEISVRGPFRLTTPARTLIDCAREEPLDAAVVAMDAALLAQRVSTQQLRDAVTRARHWRGGQRAERALALADGRAESPLETRGRLRIVGAGLPAPELQVEIWTAGRRVGVVDAWFDDAAVAVEFDGRVKYTDPWRERAPAEVLWEEKRREDEIRALDIVVVRIADADLASTAWRRVEEHLRRLLGRPAPAARRFSAVPRVRGRTRATG
jgi:predicted transcriptional regulator of viral defense system